MNHTSFDVLLSRSKTSAFFRAPLLNVPCELHNAQVVQLPSTSAVAAAGGFGEASKERQPLHLNTMLLLCSWRERGEVGNECGDEQPGGWVVNLHSDESIFNCSRGLQAQPAHSHLVVFGDLQGLGIKWKTAPLICCLPGYAKTGASHNIYHAPMRTWWLHLTQRVLS